MGNTKKILRAYIWGILLWVVSLALALKCGAVSSLDFDAIIQLRLPRVILASAVGMGLAVSGAALQALFSNPLCEPYTLGVASGAALGAVLGGFFGVQGVVAGVASSSFMGGLLFMGVLYAIASRPTAGNLRLLLAGVMLSFFGSSLVALVMALSDSSGIQGAMFWILGDLARARLGGSAFIFLATLSLTFTLWVHGRQLDALLLGEDAAAALGVNVPAIRRRIVIFVALMIGLAVSSSGMIGFVGLITPHLARRWVGSLHLRLLPLCAIWGAAILTLADVAARVAWSPYELPVGVVTAIVGAPVFVIVLMRQRRFELHE